MLRLRKNTKGQGVVFALVTMMVLILVAVIIVNALINSITPDTSWSEEANTTWANTQTNIWLALGLVVVGIIVMGAVAILGVLRGGFGGGR